MQVIIEPDYHSMSRKAAQLVTGFVSRRPACVLGLPTGDTALGFYMELVDAHKRKVADFGKIKIFNLDEYVGLTASDRGSYAFYMYSNFLSQVKLAKGSANIPDGTADDLDAECERYENEIASAGGLDLAVLGIGVNGHIGFNEPGTPFDAPCHVVKLSPQTISDNQHHFGTSEEMPDHAITMGLGTIMGARKIVLIASGPKKANAIRELVMGHMDREFPASTLHAHDDVTVIVDEAAAAELKRAGFSDFKYSDFTIHKEHTLPRNKRIAVISPHPDDSAIGAGGTLAMLAQHNEITNLVMTSGHRAHVPGKNKRERIRLRKEEARAEAEILGIGCRFLNLDFYDSRAIGDEDEGRMLGALRKVDPDIVFLTPLGDTHPTHRMGSEIAMRAMKELVDERRRMVEVWQYESPWCMFPQGDFNVFVQLPKRAVRKKVKAVRQHETQISRTPFDKVSIAMATMRGATVPEQMFSTFGALPPKFEEHAEVFSVSRITSEQQLVESLSGIRGIYGTDLTEDVAEGYAYTYGKWLAKEIGAHPKIIIGRDTRPSGRTLVEAMIRGLSRARCHVLRVGIGTTPMIQFEVRNHKSDGGIIVTASHNEPDWNGFKFLWKDGGVLSPLQMERVIDKYHRESDKEERKRLSHYIDYVNKTLAGDAIERIRDAGLKVVVDPNGGAMIVLIKRLFEHFNVETVELNMDLGVFRHKVEPTGDALDHIGPIISETGADMGVAWDCDGDRVEIVLRDGTQVSGHYVLAALVDAVLGDGGAGKVVVASNATSGVVADVAKRRGAEFMETDSGEANVVNRMYEVGAAVGGEGSCGGGIIPPSRCRDGVLTLFKILELVVRRGEPLERIIKTYPSYYTLQKNIRIDERRTRAAIRRFEQHYSGKDMRRYGGELGALKIWLSPTSFILLRPSKTEHNILRVIADSEDREETGCIMDEALGLIV